MCLPSSTTLLFWFKYHHLHILSELRKATFLYLITREQQAAALEAFINMPIFILVYNLKSESEVTETISFQRLFFLKHIKKLALSPYFLFLKLSKRKKSIEMKVKNKMRNDQDLEKEKVAVSVTSTSFCIYANCQDGQGT